MPETKTKYIQATGRHKQSRAQVRLIPGTGKIILNLKEIANIDPVTISPLVSTGLEKKYDISIKVNGGGVVGQKKSIRLGVARALLKIDSELKPSLKQLGYLSRDSREKERKKFGLKKARKSPQWSKR